MIAKSLHCPGAKLGAAAAISVLAVLGLVGLLLPVLPGVLFLAMAAVVAAKHFPSLDARLRRNRAARAHLDLFERARGLSFRRKAELFGWYGLKLVAEGAEAVARVLRRARAR